MPVLNCCLLQCDLLDHRYTSSRQSNGDGEVCPEADKSEVNKWPGSCACYRIGNLLLCIPDRGAEDSGEHKV